MDPHTFRIRASPCTPSDIFSYCCVLIVYSVLAVFHRRYETFLTTFFNLARRFLLAGDLLSPSWSDQSDQMQRKILPLLNNNTYLVIS